MNLPFLSKPKTFTDSLEAAWDQAGDRIETARGDIFEFVRSVPERLDTSRKRALAVAGGAASAAAGFAFWRSRHEETPSVNQDPAQARTPWKAAPPPPANGGSGAGPTTGRSTKKPVTDTAAAARDAAGTRSK